MCIETVTTERSKEKEIVKKNLSENDQKIEVQKEKIRELSNVVHELTTKNKHQESKIQLLELAAVEMENSHKNEIEHLEMRIREITTQFSDQQAYLHNLKTENNSMKININQLTQSLEGQKAAYENLRGQLANVYKEQQKEQLKDKANTPNGEIAYGVESLNKYNTSYIPKVNVNMANRNSSFTRNQTEVFQPQILENSAVKATMK